jgi:signal transduction histidine kinase
MNKTLLKERVLWPALIVGLGAVLIALGNLQYRWSNEVSNAGSARMRAVLSSSMLDFQRDFMREVASLTVAFPNGEADDRTGRAKYAESIDQWKAASNHASMVKAVYIVEGRPDSPPRILKLNPSTSAFESSGWPPELGELRDFVFTAGVAFHFSAHASRPHDREMRHGPPPKPGEIVIFRGRGGPPERHGPPWFIDPSIPALIHPLAFTSGGPPEKLPLRGVVIELDQAFFAKHLFPELTQRYFPSSDALGYDVTVATGGEHPQDLYSSSAPLTLADSDAALDLLAPSGPQRAMGSAVPHFRGGPEPPSPTFHAGEAPWGTPIVLFPGNRRPEDNWQLLVRNRQGSLEAVVYRLRRRNLALSFGILLVLAVTMAMLIRASRRALHLAQLQMDFVAGVSHELRTPVTVISSAAENIADGMVQDKEQLARYGNAIKNQAAQLRQLIEQILQFASVRRNKNVYDLRPAAVEGIIESALENTSEVIRGAGFRVETSIQPRLPNVMVDERALSHSLQNLITNAVKYGGEACWIGISAASRQTARGLEVLITVADRGIGVSPDEVKQIFDPFYRGTEARAAQIHGSGLGLPLAKSMVEAMGGNITVESRPQSGSSFTIHLPASAEAAEASAVPTVNPRESYSKS